MEFNNLLEKITELGASKAAIANLSSINFYDEVRQLCKHNYCGNYAKTWGCPPGVGDIEKLEQIVRKYKNGIVFQCIHQLEDSFDFEGMTQAAENHLDIMIKIRAYFREKYNDCLVLGAGGCSKCEKCSYPEESCRFPDEMTSSVEAYGMNIAELVQGSGLSYINGQNTVSFVGLVLFKKKTGQSLPEGQAALQENLQEHAEEEGRQASG